MVTLRADEVKARWYAWAQRQLGGSPERLETIASAALQAVAAGLDTSRVVEVAYSAASAYDSQQIAIANSRNTGNGAIPTNARRPNHHRIGRLLLLGLLGVVLVFGALHISPRRTVPPNWRYLIRPIHLKR